MDSNDQECSAERLERLAMDETMSRPDRLVLTNKAGDGWQPTQFRFVSPPDSSMGRAVKAFNAIHDAALTEQQGQQLVDILHMAQGATQ